MRQTHADAAAVALAEVVTMTPETTWTTPFLQGSDARRMASTHAMGTSGIRILTVENSPTTYLPVALLMNETGAPPSGTMPVPVVISFE